MFTPNIFVPTIHVILVSLVHVYLKKKKKEPGEAEREFNKLEHIYQWDMAEGKSKARG